VLHRNTTHIKPVIKFLPNSLQHVVVSHCDDCCDARAQVSQRRWKWWYKIRSLVKPHMKKSHGVRSRERGGLRFSSGFPAAASSFVDGRPVDIRLQMKPCLEIVNTTSEFAYHWAGLSQILIEDAGELSRQTCLHEN
jgi:hypothetical protein